MKAGYGVVMRGYFAHGNKQKSGRWWLLSGMKGGSKPNGYLEEASSDRGNGIRKGLEVARGFMNLRNSKEPVGLEPGV